MPEDAKPLDAAAVQKLITDAIKPIADAIKPLAENQKILADTIAADAKAKTDALAAADKAKADSAKGDAAKADPAKPLTSEDVSKLVSDGINAALAKQQQTAQTGAQRDAYIAEKLKGVPAAYAAQLGADPAKWATEEQAIRDRLKADDTARGIVIKDVSGGAPAGATATSGTAAEKITQYKTSGLSDGEAEFAATMKMPA